MKSLFAGSSVELASPGVLWLGDFRLMSEIPPPVRHAAGYDEFVSDVIAFGVEPASLASAPRLLTRYIRRRRDALRAAGDRMLDSAGIFFGNALIARVDNAQWQQARGGELEVDQDGGSVEVLRLVRAIVTADDSDLAQLDGVLDWWDSRPGDAARRRAAVKAAERQLELRAAAVLPRVPFERADGVRLVDVLTALLDYMTAYYDATATHTGPLPDDPRTVSPTIRTIRVTPHSPTGAPLVIAIDDVGAIAMRAGAFSDFYFYGPDTVDLENTVLAIAAGLYRETFSTDPKSVSGYRLGSITADGFSSAHGPTDLDPDQAPAIVAQLAEVPDGWAAWPLRTEPLR